MVGEVPAPRRSRIAWNQEPKWRTRKSYRLRARNNAETVSMGVRFGARVLVAKSVGQGQAGRCLPFVLREGCILLLVLIAGRFRVFAKLVRRSEQKIRQIISGTYSKGPGEVEDPVRLIGVDRVLLHDPEAAAKLVGMMPAIPSQRIGNRVVVVGLPGNIWIKPHVHAAGEGQRRRSEGI